MRGSRFDGFVQVGEFTRVAQEEHGRVVADHIPVAFFGIELQCKATDVAFRICCAALACHGGETGEHLGFLTDFAEDFGAGVFCDVVCHGKRTERAEPLACIRRSGILRRTKSASFHSATTPAPATGRAAVLIVGNGRAVVHGQVGNRAFGGSHDGFLCKMVSGL